MRKKLALACITAAALYATVAFARPPGPDQIGEFYFYFDEQGEVVGSASLDCDGVYSESGVRTNHYSNGFAICNPGDD